MKKYTVLFLVIFIMPSWVYHISEVQGAVMPANLSVVGESVIDQGEIFDLNITLSGLDGNPLAGELKVSEKTGVFGTDYTDRITPLGIGVWNLYIDEGWTVRAPKNYTLIMYAIPENTSYGPVVLNYNVTILTLDPVAPTVDFSVEETKIQNVTGNIFDLHMIVKEDYGLRWVSVYTDSGYQRFRHSISESTNVTGDYTINYNFVNITIQIKISDDSSIIYFQAQDYGFNTVIREYHIPNPLDKNPPAFEEFSTSDLNMEYRPGDEFEFMWRLSDDTSLDTVNVSIFLNDIYYGSYWGNEDGALITLPEHPAGSKIKGWNYYITAEDYFGHRSIKFGVIHEVLNLGDLTKSLTQSSQSDLTTSDSKVFFEFSVTVYFMIVVGYTLFYYGKKFQRIKKENGRKGK